MRRRFHGFRLHFAPLHSGGSRENIYSDMIFLHLWFRIYGQLMISTASAFLVRIGAFLDSDYRFPCCGSVRSKRRNNQNFRKLQIELIKQGIHNGYIMRDKIGIPSENLEN